MTLEWVSWKDSESFWLGFAGRGLATTCGGIQNYFELKR